MKKVETNVSFDLNDESLDISFEPIPAVCEPAGLEANLEPVEFHASGLKREVEMDGNLGDSAWKDAISIPEMLNRRTHEPLGPKTDVRLLYSPTALYVGAIMHEPDMEHLVAQFDQNDLEIYADDCLELVVDLTGRPGLYYHIVVNPLGSIYDAKDGYKNWNGEGFLAKTSRHEDKWIVELRLPYVAFDNATAPEPGEFWAVRFSRERPHNSQDCVSIPMIQPMSDLAARQFLGKLIFDAVSDNDVEINCPVSTFDMGMNNVPIEIKDNESANYVIRARVYNADNDIVSEIKQNVKANQKTDFKLPIETDVALRAVVSLLSEEGEPINSFVLDRAFPFVAPGFEKLDTELKHIEFGCDDILEICHPTYRGAKKSLRRMRDAIKEYKAKIKTAIDTEKIVEKSVTEEFAALENGFKEFRNLYSYLVWETSPWEKGSLDALPPVDYSPEFSLSFKQASNERERVALNFSGLLLDRRLDLRIVPFAIDKGDTYLPHDRFEIYMEPFVDHNGHLNTQPLLKVQGNVITVTPGSVVRVHIVFNSRDVKPGNYDTKIVIKPLYDYKIPNRDIPVNMEVWNFTLPETKDWPMDCFFWGPNRTDNDESSMLRLMHSRHVNWGWTEGIRYVKGFKGMERINNLPEGQIFDPDLVENANEEFFKTAKELGMKFVFGWDTCNSMDWHYRMEARLKKMGFTNEDFIFKAHLRDEFRKVHIYGDKSHVEIREKILEEKPDWLLQAVWLSSPPPSGATLEDIDEARLAETHKNWNLVYPLLDKSDEQTKKLLDYFKGHGCKVWAYECFTTMHTLPVLGYYRFFPWFGYQKGVDGVAIWTSLFPHGEDGLDHRDGYDDGATLMDNDRTPISTKRFEAVSKGLEDVAYMFELKKQLERLHGKIDGAEYQMYLDLITVKLDEIVKNACQEEVDEWRLAVGTAIDKLSRI